MKNTILNSFPKTFLFFMITGVLSAPQVKLETTMGDIVIELDSASAPITVANFLMYVNSSFYNEVIFHRVIEGFMIQSGGHTEDMSKKDTEDPILNEAFNGLENVRGAIAMARTSDPHSATSQFFINTVDNPRLNYSDSAQADGWGYAVFGEVIEGMEVVDFIERVITRSIPGYDDVPAAPIIINKAEEIIITPVKPRLINSQYFPPIFASGGKSIKLTAEMRVIFLYNTSGSLLFRVENNTDRMLHLPGGPDNKGVYFIKITSKTNTW